MKLDRIGFGLIALAVLVLLAAGCGGSTSKQGSDGNSITVNWGTEPPSLDPGLATDTTSANILLNIMDPLVKLDANLEPVPNLAESWKKSDGGKTITFKLRSDGRWTNGDPVTAYDFEYSWKRTLSPELGADYAYQFYGIVGAEAYNACKSKCGPLRTRSGSRPWTIARSRSG
jgi:oligopeptide transport system substrate-binding protein